MHMLLLKLNTVPILLHKVQRQRLSVDILVRLRVRAYLRNASTFPQFSLWQSMIIEQDPQKVPRNNLMLF